MRGLRVGLGLLLLVFAGCGAARTDVHGAVSCRGKPVVSGTDAMVTSDGTVLTGAIKPDSTFEVRGIPPGAVRVSVSSLDPRKPARGNPVAKKATPPPEVVKGWFPLPQVYSRPSTTPLTPTIVFGQREYPIELANEPR